MTTEPSQQQPTETTASPEVADPSPTTRTLEETVRGGLGLGPEIKLIMGVDQEALGSGPDWLNPARDRSFSERFDAQTDEVDVELLQRGGHYYLKIREGQLKDTQVDAEGNGIYGPGAAIQPFPEDFTPLNRSNPGEVVSLGLTEKRLFVYQVTNVSEGDKGEVILELEPTRETNAAGELVKLPEDQRETTTATADELGLTAEEVAKLKEEVTAQKINHDLEDGLYEASRVPIGWENEVPIYFLSHEITDSETSNPQQAELNGQYIMEWLNYGGRLWSLVKDTDYQINTISFEGEGLLSYILEPVIQEGNIVYQLYQRMPDEEGNMSSTPIYEFAVGENFVFLKDQNGNVEQIGQIPRKYEVQYAGVDFSISHFFKWENVTSNLDPEKAITTLFATIACNPSLYQALGLELPANIASLSLEEQAQAVVRAYQERADRGEQLFAPILHHARNTGLSADNTLEVVPVPNLSAITNISLVGMIGIPVDADIPSHKGTERYKGMSHFMIYDQENNCWLLFFAYHDRSYPTPEDHPDVDPNYIRERNLFTAATPMGSTLSYMVQIEVGETSSPDKAVPLGQADPELKQAVLELAIPQYHEQIVYPFPED